MKKESINDWIEAIRSGVLAGMQNKEVRRNERLYGCDFGGHLYKDDLGYKNGEGYDYTPSFNHPKKYCSSTIIKSDDVVLDLGCGKGYAMFLLGKYPFKCVYGIEKSPVLAEIAKRNCLNYDEPNRYRVIEEDILDAFTGKSKILIDSTTIFYCYNSFPKDIMEKVIIGIENSVRNRSRKVFLWYAQPDLNCLEVVNERVVRGIWECTMKKRHLGQMIYAFSCKL